MSMLLTTYLADLNIVDPVISYTCNQDQVDINLSVALWWQCDDIKFGMYWKIISGRTVSIWRWFGGPPYP